MPSACPACGRANPDDACSCENCGRTLVAGASAGASISDFAATPFVGRAEELARLTSLLADPACRLNQR